MPFARLLIPALAALVAASTLPRAAAQHADAPGHPVRYDTDLLPPEFHRGRRLAVFERLPEDAIAVVFSAPGRVRDRDVEYEYRQLSDLYYLTGMTEPATVLVLAPGKVEIDGENVQELLFVPPRDPDREVWDGRRLGPAGAEAELGIEKAVSNERFESFMEGLGRGSGRRFFHLALPEAVDPGSALAEQIRVFSRAANPMPVKTRGRTASMAVRSLLAVEDPAMFGRVKRFLGRTSPEDFETPLLKKAREAFMAAGDVGEWLAWRRENIDERYADGITLTGILADLRSVKTAEEIEIMQRAIDITTAAHREAIRTIEPGMYEYEAEALIEYVFRRNGSEYPGFPTIVASGENSTILHYESNRRRMIAGDMVVMDIGAEYHGYSADVTRTVPVSGTFSDEQRSIYEIVLAAQEAGIAATRAGESFRAPHDAATEVIASGLMDLGIISDAQQVRRFFNHGTSHYLGLSVHDVGGGGPLRPGTVITVEPGIYIRPAPDVDERWWNIGVRIEDDILVTEGDPVNMSRDAPRSADAIEEMMRERGLGNDPRGATGTAGP